MLNKKGQIEKVEMKERTTLKTILGPENRKYGIWRKRNTKIYTDKLRRLPIRYVKTRLQFYAREIRESIDKEKSSTTSQRETFVKLLQNGLKKQGKTW